MSVVSRVSRRLCAYAGCGLLAVLGAAGCERERRGFADRPDDAVAERLSTILPGPGDPVPRGGEGVYDGNAWAVSEGKRLYASMNCKGCHANGGGGMGPALMDDTWIYGVEPEQIYHSIVDGRPNGMPSWHDQLTEQQVWQLVAYVRSLSGLIPKDVRPGRDDHMMSKPPEQQTPTAMPSQSQLPQSQPPQPPQ
jgi:cytochrome c oxidase cbb3-type subunit 3